MSTRWKVTTIPIEKTPFEPGESIISASGRLIGDGTSTDLRFQLEFLDSSDAVISTHAGNTVTPGLGDALVSRVENVQVPAAAKKIRGYALNPTDEGNPGAEQWMLNAGPVALPYRAPKFNFDRDRISARHIVGGRFEDPTGQYGVLLLGEVPGGWTRYLNPADPSEPFLRHEALELGHDGTAKLGGVTVSAPDGGAVKFDVAGGGDHPLTGALYTTVDEDPEHNNARHLRLAIGALEEDADHKDLPVAASMVYAGGVAIFNMPGRAVAPVGVNKWAPKIRGD